MMEEKQSRNLIIELAAIRKSFRATHRGAAELRLMRKDTRLQKEGQRLLQSRSHTDISIGLFLGYSLKGSIGFRRVRKSECRSDTMVVLANLVHRQRASQTCTVLRVGLRASMFF